MTVIVITPPAPLVLLSDAKQHLRVVADDEDTLIDSYIAAASAWIDGPAGWLGRSIGEQTLELTTAGFEFDQRLPFGPVKSISSITYTAAGGVETTVDPAIYRLVDGSLVLANNATWPGDYQRPDGVRVRYVAGEADVPPQVRQAALLLVGQWFRNRMSVVVGTISSALPFGVDALLSPLRRYT